MSSEKGDGVWVVFIFLVLWGINIDLIDIYGINKIWKFVRCLGWWI